MNTNKPTSGRLSPKVITALADILANFHDWDCDDLPGETINSLESKSKASEELIITEIVASFLALPPNVRFSSDFKHTEFVENYLNIRALDLDRSTD